MFPAPSRTKAPFASCRYAGTRSSAPDRTKMSDSCPSTYRGSPLSVLRVIEASAKFQPKPNTPFPAPESYEMDNCGPKPERPGLVAIGTDIEPVPDTGFVVNCSSMPRIAPPPLG